MSKIEKTPKLMLGVLGGLLVAGPVNAQPVKMAHPPMVQTLVGTGQQTVDVAGLFGVLGYGPSLHAAETTLKNAASGIESSTVILAKAIRRGDATTQNNYSAVFSSVSIPFANLPAAKKWRGVYPAVTAATFKCGEGAACGTNDARLATVLGNLKGRSFQEKLDRINNIINAMVTYTTDDQQYGKRDYWASPSETLDRGRGDCEDYAILKMAALQSIGFPLHSMSVVVVRDTRRNLYHAVLAVSTSKGHYILDNLRRNVPVDLAYSNYQPLFSLSANRAWIHGRKIGTPNVAASDLTADATPG